MTTPRDDLMVLAAVQNVHEEADRWRQWRDEHNVSERELRGYEGRMIAASFIELSDALQRLAASRPAPVGREGVAQFLTAWDSLPIGKHSLRTLEKWLNSDAMRDSVAVLRSLLCPAEPVELPGMTDLMVTPESLDAFMEANPLPYKPTTPDAVGEPVAWRLVPVKLTEEMMDAGCEIDAYDIAMRANKKSHEELMAKYPDVVKPKETHGAAACQTLPMIWEAMLEAAPKPPASPDTSAASIWETAVARLNGEQGYDWSVHIGEYLWSQIGRSEKTKLEMDAFVDRIFLDVEASINAGTSAAVLAERERCAACVRQLHDETFHFPNVAVAGDIHDVIGRVLNRAEAAICQLPTPERGEK